MSDKNFTSEELRDIAARLEIHDAVFSQLWQISTHTYNSKIPTACVAFNDIGEVLSLEMSPTFWRKQTPIQKDFVICHEMLHVILEHGRRAVDSEVENRDANNVAMDVVVNELLVKSFGFLRKDVDPKNKLCWIDTVFPKRKDVLPDKCFEYYLDKLPKTYVNKASKDGTGNVILDDHKTLPTGDIGGLAKKVADKLSTQEREVLSNKIQNEVGPNDGSGRGDEGGTFTRVMSAERVPRKRKWETLIKKCLKDIVSDGVEESWLSASARRIATLQDSKIILPVEIYAEGRAKNRASIYMFLDTSGSCTQLAPRFWRLAKSVPRDTFDIKLRCFDTKVYEISFENKKLYGFGGTSFDILEEHIQKEIKDGEKYPDGIFVLTDGYGNKVSPSDCSKWHVLLTTNYKTCFPSSVKCYDLRQFE
jgi:hypothetical protein